MYQYFGKNIRPFTAICDCNFGRRVIYTNKAKISAENIIDELNKALVIHNANAREIEYLDRYYRGDQPILYRKKVNRPDVNNKIVLNLAYELVERKTAEICAEPIQYVLRGTDDKKSEEITELNITMDSESKQECDIDICRWRSICGTAYRFIGNDEGNGDLLDESDFALFSENPMYTFVVYYSNNRPAFSCQIREGESGETIYFCYTNVEWFRIIDGGIESSGLNGNGAIPVVEYPNNARRLSDIEITEPVTNAINTLNSDRVNGIEQFVSSWVKFVNCSVDSETFSEMKLAGALVVKSNNGENKADVDIMSQELNQTEGQVVLTDLFEHFLGVQGLSNRGSLNSGGDTGSAVRMRNGHIDAELRGAINEPIMKKSERMALKIILNRLRIKRGFALMPSDIEIHINHHRADNLLTKSEALKLLLEAGVDYKRAIKTVDLFSDSEAVAAESKERMEYLYPTKAEQLQQTTTAETEKKVGAENDSDNSNNL